MANERLYGMNRPFSEIPDVTSSNLMRRNIVTAQKSEHAGPVEIIDTLVVVPPDGGWGWIIVIVAFFSNFVADGTMYTFGVFLEEIATSIGCTKTEIALANSLMTGFYFLTGPIIGALINKYGIRPIAILGGVIASVSIIITSFCTTLYSLIFVYGVTGGTGFGMLYLTSTIVVGFYFERWRALAQSISCCGSSLGIIAFPPIFTILLKEYYWREKFRILAVFVLTVAILFLLYRPLRPIRVVALEDEGGAFFDRPSVYMPDAKGSGVSGVKSNVSKYHNIAFPTTADIHKRSMIAIREARRISTASVVTTTSKASTSAPRASVGLSKPSIKSIKSKISNLSGTKTSAEILRTVYEEEERVDGKCKRFCKRCYCCHEPEHITAARPLYRDDIFYGGSIATLPEYVKSIQSPYMLHPSYEKASVDYHLSVTRTATQRDYEEDFLTCVCCPEAIKRSLATMLDLSVLKSPSFLLLSLSGLFSTLGLFTPFLFIADRAKDNGMDAHLSFSLISTLGISNTVGRILSGILSSIPNVKALMISYISITICGLVTLMSSVSFTNFWQFGFASIYGLTVACVASLRPIVVVDMVGLEKLTNAFGISLVFQGLACLAGIPLSGYLRDVTGNYELSFYFAGGVLLISAILLMPIKRISMWEKRKQTQRDAEQAAQLKMNNPK